MEHGKRVTQRDVAERAGVSTAVVSYVINDGPRPTSPEIRQRVLDAITELDYHPNGFARGLRVRKTHTIAFITSDWNPRASFGSHYLAAILGGLTETLKERGNYLLIYPMLIGEATRDLDALLRSGRLDGVVLRLVQDPPATDTLTDLIRAAGVPCVCIERPASPRFGFPTVTYDDAAGARAATAHLIAAGHRRIAHLCGDRRYATALARLDGYRQSLISAGIPIDSDLIRVANWHTSLAAHETRHLLALDQPPTAIFAASDDMAIGALDAARDLGYRVPNDVAIVGFDDISLSQELTLSLSTVRIPLDEIGRRAANLILSGGQLGNTPELDILPVTLIQRQSS